MLGGRFDAPSFLWSTARAMANIKSQIKRNRSNERRRVRNQTVRSELKTRVKTATRAIDEGSEDAPEAVRLAQKRLGKAASKGRIHKNQAARRTSRLMKKATASAE
jgi:small subunit ribosomal protein S20